MTFTDYLNMIIKRQDLSMDQMGSMLSDIFSGTITEAQIGAFMAALAVKGETFEELAGAARAMRRKAARIQTISQKAVDTCGTGGDASGSFNISTTTAFVVAGCGITVAKHGNRSISSKCGSADVLEALGVNINTDPEVVEEAVNEIGIGFLFAPTFHSAMRHAAKARKDVGIKSIFNMLGPLTNPAAARCQLLGVFAPELTEMFAEALKLLGTHRAFVVHGHDGMDEITVCAPTRVSELNNGIIRSYDLDPLEFFDQYADPSELKGGDVNVNAAITTAILNGEKGPRRNVVLINSAAALVAADSADNLADGIKKASQSIDSGSALEKLKQLVRFTQENA
ncbi:Anthranilate phosphoribosyltransferase [Desulfamplus magnetovallimortis]|uniref:Anthranilate phosphoribosyltransferase n=1 Tax=Desulfamplus magnetovallimortis TaxID=1246637 RepID=A0A1W1HL83_9BACT|nr:anthranilate phosphoribosyltransferase [Desulfamplus magnetovallimortis]SLM33196.1 Anthranilate phosphoribosyltransferase [Desulfamplus magnetovallimortis]